MLRKILLIAFAFLPLVPARAQQSVPAPPSLTATVDVKIINVDVTVMDGDKPVTGLQKDDFDVLEDGQPQKITNFLAVSREGRGPAPGQTALPDARQFRRRTFLLIDNNYLEKRDRDIAISKLRAFVDEADADSEWSVGTIGQQLSVLVPFTSDRPKVHAALVKAGKAAVTSLRATDDDREILNDPFRRNRKTGDFGQTARFESRERTTRNARSFAYLAQGLAESAQSCLAAEGKKSIILVTGNIEMNSSFSAFDVNSDRELQDTKNAIARLIDAVITNANAANITVFVLNAASHSAAVPQHGVENQSFGGSNDLNTNAPVDISEADSAGLRIALGTGGLYLRSNFVEEALGRIGETSAHYYSLGYVPKHEDDGEYHHIDVRVKKPGVRVVHREGYVDLSPDQKLEQLLRLRISTLQPARGIPVTLDLGRPNLSEQKPLVSLTAATPFKNLTLLRSKDGYATRVHIYLSIFDKSGKNVGFHHMVQEVKVPEAQHTRAMADNFKYQMSLRLERGVFTIALTMRDELSREIGTAVEALKL